MTQQVNEPVAPLLDKTAAAEILACSPRKVRSLWEQGKLGGRRVGRSVRFSHADLAEYIERNHRPPTR